MKNIFRELTLRLPFPSNSVKSRLLYNKWIKPVRFKGTDILLKGNVKIKRRLGLMLGHNVTFEGKNHLDATAGIMLGDGVTLDKGTNLSTQSRTFPPTFAPIIIGAGNQVTQNLAPGTILPNKKSVRGLSDYQGQIIFVLSTGRSGSNAIIKILQQHPQAEAYHDSFPPIYTWSCQYLYQEETKEQIKDKLHALYNAVNMQKGQAHIQSDQKLAPLVGILAQLFPSAKFIWLIRRAEKFISSSYPRGWFQDKEFGYPQRENVFFRPGIEASVFDAVHRTHGARVGAFSETEWQQILPFERNCWYWSYWNQLIEKELGNIAPSRWIQLQLEDLGSKLPEVLDFIGLAKYPLTISKTNQAYYDKITPEQWSPEMKKIFHAHCSELLNKWYHA